MKLFGRKKGVEGPLWEAMAMIAIVATFAVLILIISSGALGGIFSSFCAHFPSLCGEPSHIEEEYYVKAENSFRALTCAVESVGTGTYMCSDEVADATELNKLMDQGEDDNYNDVGPVVECERDFECGYLMGGDCYSSEDIHVKAFDRKSAKEACQETYDQKKMNVMAFEDCLTEGKMDIEECRVRNLQLPQLVSTSPGDWIVNYGDPKFLIYYQIFPLNRDTWSYRPDWQVHAAIAVLTAFPPTKLAGALVKGAGKELAERGVSLVVKKAWDKGSGKMANWIVGKVSGETLERAVTGTGREALKDVMKESAVKMLVNRFKGRGLVRVVTKAGVLEGAYTVAKVLERSMSAKYEPHGNSMILKSPYDEPLIIELVEDMKGLPVMVSWKPGVASWRIDSAHLVSPCLVHDATVQRKTMQCKDEYVYMHTTGEVYCGGAVWDKGGTEPKCELEEYTGSVDPHLVDMETIMKTPIEEQIRYLEESLGARIWEQNLEVVRDNAGELEDTFNVQWVDVEYPKEDEIDYLGMKIRVKTNNRYVYYSDQDDDGFFETYGMQNCVTDTVNVWFDEWSRNRARPDGEYSYCLDPRTWWDKGKEYLIVGASIGGLVLAPFTGGASTFVTALSLGGGAALESVAAYQEYKQYWPGSRY